MNARLLSCLPKFKFNFSTLAQQRTAYVGNDTTHSGLSLSVSIYLITIISH